jgi:aldehyde:ferredoxin oxidoreductase
MAENGYGWVGKILRVDLTGDRIWTEDTSGYAADYVGGRGIAARIAWNEIGPEVGPFDPDNRLMLMTGPLTGTCAPGSGRVEVMGVAAQTHPRGRYSRSGMGGRFGPELKYAGFDGIVIQGQAEEPVYLWIHDGEAELRPAKDLWGLDYLNSIAALRKQLGNEIQIAGIGPSGENVSRIASIQTGSESGAGQGGFGGVMGAKKLKAIVAQGTGGVQIADPEGLLKVSRDPMLHEMCWPIDPKTASPASSDYPRSLPWSCSFSCTAWDGAQFWISPVQTMQHCSGYNATTKEGNIAIRVVSNSMGVNEWEMPYGIIPWLIMMANEGGHRREIEAWVGAVVPEYEGAMEYLNQCPSYPADLATNIISKVANREDEIGDALAEGIAYASQKLFNGDGKEFMYRIDAGYPHTAGYAGHWDDHWMHAAAKYPGWLVSALMWATDTRDPADDTLHQYIDNISLWPEWGGGPISRQKSLEVGKIVYGTEDGLDNEKDYVPGKAAAGKWHRNRAMIVNSLPVCDWFYPRLFSWYTKGYGNTDLEAKLFSACTGVDLTEDELDRIGERIWNLERAIEVRYGRTRQWDEDIIRSYYWTGRPDMQGKYTLDPDRFISTILEPYYEQSGWDKQNGRPTRQKLVELGLQDVADELDKIE